MGQQLIISSPSKSLQYSSQERISALSQGGGGGVSSTPASPSVKLENAVPFGSSNSLGPVPPTPPPLSTPQKSSSGGPYGTPTGILSTPPQTPAVAPATAVSPAPPPPPVTAPPPPPPPPPPPGPKAAPIIKPPAVASSSSSLADQLSNKQLKSADSGKPATKAQPRDFLAELRERQLNKTKKTNNDNDGVDGGVGGGGGGGGGGKVGGGVSSAVVEKPKNFGRTSASPMVNGHDNTLTLRKIRSKEAGINNVDASNSETVKTPQRGSTASNCSFVTSADLDRMKAEILEEMRAEMNKMQEEIIAAIRNLK